MSRPQTWLRRPSSCGPWTAGGIREGFITTRVTNAESEAANLTGKNLTRTGRGYRNHGNYQARIMLHRSAQMAA